MSNSKSASFHGFAAAYDRGGSGDAVAFRALIVRRRKVRPPMKKEVQRQRYMWFRRQRYTRVVLKRIMQVGYAFCDRGSFLGWRCNVS